MSEPFLAEIKMVGFNFAPRGFALCDGQTLPINQNQSLFSLLGTTYGGDGRTTFRLPDLRGRAPIHVGTGPNLSTRDLGDRGGAETQGITEAQMPEHSHVVQATSDPPTLDDPAGNVLAGPSLSIYAAPSVAVDMEPLTIADAGLGLGHPNLQPFQVLNFVIALQGLFPSRN